jgi:hypothetical protein
MTTKLDTAVRRSCGIELQGRDVIFGLELVNGRPCLTLKQKGLHSGWFASLEDIVVFAVKNYPRLKVDQEIVIKADRKQLDSWKDELETKRVE